MLSGLINNTTANKTKQSNIIKYLTDLPKQLSTAINGYQLLSTAVNGYQRLSTAINGYQLLSTAVNGYQRLSTASSVKVLLLVVVYIIK